MTVDELLEKNVRTPSFTTHRYIPNEGKLKTKVFSYSFHGEECEADYIYSPTDPSWTPATAIKKGEKFAPDAYRFMPDSYAKAAGLRFEAYQTNNISLLKETIKLAEKYVNTDNPDNEEGIYFNIDIPQDALYRFIYTYGFPTDKGINDENINVVKKTDEWKNMGHNEGVFVGDINWELSNILFIYALWKALFINDHSLLRKLNPTVTDRETMIELLIEFCCGSLKIRIEFDSDKPQLVYHANNLFELMKAQLAVLVSKGDDYLEGGCIAYCMDCGQPFIQYRKNSTLCADCKTGAAKQRRHRIKMKGAVNNG